MAEMSLCLHSSACIAILEPLVKQQAPEQKWRTTEGIRKPSLTDFQQFFIPLLWMLILDHRCQPTSQEGYRMMRDLQI